MTKPVCRVALVRFIPLLFVTLPAAAAVQPNETSLRAADAEELRIVLTGDADAMRALMGRETIKPKSNSELGLAHGVKTLERRFTNVFIFEQGNWRLLARQSTVIQANP